MIEKRISHDNFNRMVNLWHFTGFWNNQTQYGNIVSMRDTIWVHKIYCVNWHSFLSKQDIITVIWLVRCLQWLQNSLQFLTVCNCKHLYQHLHKCPMYIYEEMPNVWYMSMRKHPMSDVCLWGNTQYRIYIYEEMSNDQCMFTRKCQVYNVCLFWNTQCTMYVYEDMLSVWCRFMRKHPVSNVCLWGNIQWPMYVYEEMPGVWCMFQETPSVQFKFMRKHPMSNVCLWGNIQWSMYVYEETPSEQCKFMKKCPVSDVCLRKHPVVHWWELILDGLCIIQGSMDLTLPKIMLYIII